MSRFATLSIVLLALALLLGLLVLGVLALPLFPWQGWFSIPLVAVAFVLVSARTLADGNVLVYLGCLLFAAVPAVVTLFIPGEIAFQVMPVIDTIVLVAVGALILLFLINGIRAGGIFLAALLACSVALGMGSWSQNRIIGAHIERKQQVEQVKASKEVVEDTNATLAEREDQIGGRLFLEQTEQEALDFEGMTEADAEMYRRKMEEKKKADAILEEARKKAQEDGYSYRDRVVDRSVLEQGEAAIDEDADPDAPDSEDFAALGGEAQEDAAEVLLDYLTYSEEIAYKVKNYADLTAVLTKLTLFLGALLAGIYYLRQLNWAFPVLYPLPIAGRWLDRFFGREARMVLRGADDAQIADFLVNAARKGESFIYFGEEAVLPDGYLPRIPLLWYLPHMTNANPRFFDNSDFVIESAWFRRYAFSIIGLEDGQRYLLDFVEAMKLRRRTRAQARRTLNIVWNHPEPIPAQLFETLSFCAASQNLRVVLGSDTDDDPILDEHLDNRFDAAAV